jgi:hypothetical protein
MSISTVAACGQKYDAGWHLVDMDANRDALGQAHPREYRVDIGDPLSAVAFATLMARACWDVTAQIRRGPSA